MEERSIKRLDYVNSGYLTTPRPIGFLARVAPSFLFYCRFFWIVFSASRKAKRGVYDDAEWYNSSYDVLKQLEKIGIRFRVTGVENVRSLQEPCVIIGNHMSMMETVVLPTIIHPEQKLTFVVKESLLTYPVFKHVMLSRNPIAVTRINPRQDLKIVMEQGPERLARGMSIIVFPQTTRARVFNPEQMSTIGVKLAKKADVPIVPLALHTGAWNNGKLIKDFGRLETSQEARFAFGKPIRVQGKGTEEHRMVLDFIEARLKEWALEG